MAEPALEWTGDNFNTQHISRKEENQMIVEKDLIAEQKCQVKEGLSAEVVIITTANIPSNEWTISKYNPIISLHFIAIDHSI